MSRHTKTITAYTTLALILVSILGGLLLTIPPLLVRAQATGTIVLSSANLNPAKTIEIEVRGDLGDGPLTVDVRAPGDVLVTSVQAVRYAPNRYVAYLRGSAAAPTPSSPKVDLSRYQDAIANVTNVDKGTPLTIEVRGTDIRTTVVYDTVLSKTTIDVPGKEVAYRRLDFVVPFRIEDMDLNYDPTRRDSIPAGRISVTVRLIKAEGGTVEWSGTLAGLNLNSINETAVNSGVFEARVTVSRLNTLLSSVLGGRPIYKDDRVMIVVGVTVGAQGGWTDPAPGTSADAFTAVYRAPRVEVTIDDGVRGAKHLVIRVVSPDDNKDPKAEDTLDAQDINGPNFTPDGTTDAEVWVRVGTASTSLDPRLFRETGLNTGVFELRLPVFWNTSDRVTATNVTFATGSSTRLVEVHYRIRSGQTRPEGYNVDAYTSFVFAAARATVSVVRGTVVTIRLSVTDRDLNTRAEVVEHLEPAYATAGRLDLWLNRTLAPGRWVRLARLAMKDVYGNLVAVDTTRCPAVSQLISFVETDFDSGRFDVKINARCLRVSPDEEYFIEYTDLTGSALWVTVLPVRLAPIAITLDRAVVPINRDAPVDVVITYENDVYNRDPSKCDDVTVVARIYTVAQPTVPYRTYPVVLVETDVDTGVFSGRLTIPADDQATPAIIDATLEVVDQAYPDLAVAKATLRSHDASIEVDKTTIRFGEAIRITVRDPDANRRTYSALDSVTVTLLVGTTTIRTLICYETGANTGVFSCTTTISYETPEYQALLPGQTVTVRYVDRTPLMSPTAASWREVPYVATFRIVSFTGELIVETVEEGVVGVLEEFDVVVKDPDLNRWTTRADTGQAYTRDVLAVAFEGIPQAPTYNVGETGANTGVFTLYEAHGYLLSLARALQDAGILTPGLTPRQRAEVMARYVGKKVSVSYIDETNAAGAREIITKTLVIKAWDAVIRVSKEAVNVGEWLVINVTNYDIARTTVPEYKMVIVRSTTYPAGLMFYLEEVSPGVFQLRIQVVDVKDWVPGAKQIPAKLGDTITIEYVDPVSADGRAYVTVTKTVTVGVYVEMPGKAERVKTYDVATGAEVTPKVGREVFLSVTIKNTDIVERTMTVIVVVRDARGVAVARFAASVTLGAGASTEVSFGWIPIASGKHTVEIYIVKSLADRTPVGTPASFEVPVE